MQNRIYYHVREPFIKAITCSSCGKENLINTGKPIPLFTLGMHYCKSLDTLYVAYAKPNPKDIYVKSFGINVVNNRLDKMINNENITYGNNMPRIVAKNINSYINKAKRYFKEMTDTSKFFI